jgi:GDP-4-dehydro-6-deoxy-D-mannose reductase
MTVAPRNILVTGASGFVGRHLMAALAAEYPRATLLTPAIDVQNAAEVEAAVRAVTPDVCIHLAAVSAFAAAQQAPGHAWQVNLHGTTHLAWALSRHAPNCQMLFVSSADAYGASFRAGLKLDEDAPLAPMNVYAETKAIADLVLGGMAVQGMRVVRLRPFNHIGPGQAAQFVVASFARQIARIAAGLQPPVLQVGNLDTWRDFLDVRDVCSAYIKCIAKRDVLAPGTVLNLASGQARRIGDVLTELAALAGVVVEISVDASRVRDTDIRMACGNAARARELLDWSPVVPWEQSLRDVLDEWQRRVALRTDGPSAADSENQIPLRVGSRG